MSKVVCWLEDDASRVRLRIDGDELTWTAEIGAPPPPGESAPPEAPNRRVLEAAAWTAEQLAARRRIGLLVIGVDEALCTWLATPRLEPAVITAALRQRQEDWGDAAANLIQPLVSQHEQEKPAGLTLTRKKPAAKKNPATRKHVAVLQIADGAARLFLQELDRLGVTVTTVTTTWHALPLAWTSAQPAPPKSEGPVAATLLIDEDGAATWAWGDNARLLAGGVTGLHARPHTPRHRIEDASDEQPPDPLEAAAARLTLDWLTWSVHLGRRPSRITLVGNRVEDLARRLRDNWPGADIATEPNDDPLSATLARLAEAPDSIELDPEDPRAGVVSLTCRPTRAHRRLYLASAAAIALLAAAAGALGLEFQGWATEARRDARAMRSDIQQRVGRFNLPGVDVLPVQTLTAHLNQLRTQQPDFREPPAPLPMLDELVRLSRPLKDLAEVEGARLNQIEMSEANAQAIVRLDEFGPLETLRDTLSRSEGLLRWRGIINGAPPDVALRLTGVWTEAAQ
ncbi:MAG: hypothetical protein VYC34_02810 [Planctomycetota bacterium]|nr:hypothetical protein [Planctomycetota bacterium]